MGKLRIVSWNVNSVRRRLDQVGRLQQELSADVLCLQETKVHDDEFPLRAIRDVGFSHIEVNGQKSYHGVAVLSRVPLGDRQVLDLSGSGPRHLGVTLDVSAIGAAPITVQNFYVPAGGDEPDPAVNAKFKDKLAYLKAMARWGRQLAREGGGRHVAVGDLNVAPLEHDVWSHKQLLKVVSHTPVEVELFERARASGGWDDVMRRFTPPDEKLYTWWSYRARDWRASNRGRRLDHIWVGAGLRDAPRHVEVAETVRDWESPSDHAPVVLDLEV